MSAWEERLLEVMPVSQLRLVILGIQLQLSLKS
jgi:hypothetical protein